MLRLLQFLFFLIALAGCMWMVGLMVFLMRVPREAQNDPRVSDAIIVLTGGSERIAYGFQLLREGKAEQLFITGVGEGATVHDLLREHGRGSALADYEAEGKIIILGHEANNTVSNVVETARWLKEKKYHSLRLVTASYHMPRSMLLFTHAFPEAEFIPEPVFPQQFNRAHWLLDKRSRHLVLSEYHKYLAVWFGMVAL